MLSVLSCVWKSSVPSVSVLNITAHFFSFMLKKMSVGENQVLYWCCSVIWTAKYSSESCFSISFQETLIFDTDESSIVAKWSVEACTNMNLSIVTDSSQFAVRLPKGIYDYCGAANPWRTSFSRWSVILHNYFIPYGKCVDSSIQLVCYMSIYGRSWIKVYSVLDKMHLYGDRDCF